MISPVLREVCSELYLVEHSAEAEARRTRPFASLFTVPGLGLALGRRQGSRRAKCHSVLVEQGV